MEKRGGKTGEEEGEREEEEGKRKKGERGKKGMEKGKGRETAREKGGGVTKEVCSVVWRVQQL